MKRQYFGSVIVGALVLVGCSSSESSKASRQSIVNGTPFSDVDADLSPAVNFRSNDCATPPCALQRPVGSGVLLAPDVVLTAGHVPLGENPLTFTAVHGNSAREKSSLVDRVVYYPGFRRQDRLGIVGVDLSIVFLKGFISAPTTEFPDLDCDLAPPTKVECESGTIHQIRPGRLTPGGPLRPVAFRARGLFNTATFDVVEIAERVGPEIDYLPNTPFFFGAPQAPADGDSGMGCFDDDTGELSVIHNQIADPGNALSHGYGNTIAEECNWIKELVRFGPGELAFEQQIDKDGTPDLVALAPLGGGTFSLTINRTNLGSQSFPVIPASTSVLRTGAMGNFSKTGQTLAVADGSGLKTLAFNGGPAPAINNAPSTDYVMLQTVQMDGDGFDDLVAQRGTGEIDAFLGGSAGLTFTAAIKPVPLRIDTDTLADFVWVNGGSGIHTSSTRFGHTFRDAIPNTLHLTQVKSGRFRRLSGSTTALQDIITVGDGAVIWCKSTGGGGLGCEPALDAPFATGRSAQSVAVSDINADGLDDLEISYSTGSNLFMLGRPNGFTPIPAARTFTSLTPADVTGSGRPGGVVGTSISNNKLLVSFFDAAGTEFGPFDFGIPAVSGTKAAVAVGNVNDDGSTPSALAAGLVPKQDIVILSGGKIYVLLSNGNGTFSSQPLDAQTGFTDLSVSDVTGDGIDDIEGKRADGSVTLYAGSSTGLKPAGDNFTGLPTPDGTDGKLLLLSGLGVDTVGATEARIRIRAAANDPASLDHLTVQVFDGDNGGFNQFDKTTNLLKTCYRLLPDPCGDGNMGNCAGGPQTQTPIVTVSSDTLHDNAWDTIFTGPHSPQASMGGNGQPPFAYDLRVYLAADCSQPPAPGTQVQVATADGFKVRATGMVSMPLGEFSLVGSDSTGAFGLPNLPYMPDTNYDGSFSLPIAVSSSATEIQLKESDADSLLDSTKGVSLGANSTIQYQLLRPNGTQAPLTGGENTTATNVVTNPSGNNNGVTTFDVETRIAKITTPTPGTWIWKWDNVMAGNAFHLFTPPGSPTTHEVLGALRARPTVTTAQEPAFWQAAPAELPQALPVVLGHQSAIQGLEGGSLYLSTSEAVQSALDNVSGSLQGELERQLLTAKLNVRRSLALGEDINGALVYGRTLSVRTVMRAADDLVAGVDPLADDARVSELIGLLSSVNLGELNYQLPGVPFPDDPMADDDGDGIVNMKDNCPAVANVFQQDSDDDRIGDACHVRPIASCVLQRSESELEAFFGYENPLSFRAFAIGNRNLLTDNGQPLEPSQPSEFAAGPWSKAFHQTFEATRTLAWTLDGETVFANNATAACSGRELTVVDFAPQTVLFGSDSIVLGENCRVTAPQGESSVVSGGDIQIGRSSVIGNVFAGGHAGVSDHTTVLGTAATSAGLNKRPTATVAVSRTFTPRAHSLAWQVKFASTGLSDVTAPERHPYALAPGDYGDVVVEPQGQLILSAGQYRFRSLTVRDQGSLRVASGDAVVHVADSLQHSGDTRLLGDASLVIGYFGNSPATIVGSLQAAVIAPNAELNLGAAGHTSYSGTFFAKRVVVSPGTHLEYFDAKR